MRRILVILTIALLSTMVSGCFFFPRRADKQGNQTTGSAMIQGQVVDEAYRPLPGASVTVMGLQQTVLTGPDGKYTLTGLSGDVQNIIVQKEQYLMGVVSLDFSSAASRVLSTAPTLRLLSTEGSLHMDSSRIPPVEGKGPCAQCHQLHTPTDYLPVGAMNDSCYKSSCHSTTKAAGRFPDRTIFDASPHRLAVWPGQKNTPGNCGSCHEPHGVVGPSDPTPSMLRLGEIVSSKRSANNLCFACHEDAGTGNAVGWPGRTAYVASTNKHNAIADSTGKYVNGDCLICHMPHGRSGDPEMLRQNTNNLCLSCHTNKISASSGHNGNCLMCHDPHDVGASSTAAKVKLPDGTKVVLTKANDYREDYRDETNLIKNKYCQKCHTTPAPTGYSSAKDPFGSATGFKNSTPEEWQTESNLHKVHVNLPLAGSATGWDTEHGIIGLSGDFNKVRCNQCHSVHQTTLPPNLSSRYLASISKPYVGTFGTYSGNALQSKSGCSVKNGCHTCQWCHESPGSPASACYACEDENYPPKYHSDSGHSGINY